MKNNKNANHTPQDLVNDLRALIIEAEKMTGEALSEHTTDAISGLRQRYDAAQEQLGEYYEVAKQRIVDGAKRTDTVIRANPYQSLAVAAGLGLLIGVLVGRRSNS